MQQKTNIRLDFKTALQKAEAYCAYQERSQYEVRGKLISLGIYHQELEQIILNLLETNFLNEERFANAYARGKMRMKSWGKNKIKQGLKFKQVSPPLIKKALQNLNILQQQLDSVRGSLYGNIENIASNNDLNINPLKQKSRVGTQKKQVNLQIDGALLTELVKNVELSKIALRKETPLVQIIDTPSLPLDKIKIGKIKGGLSSMLFFFFLCISYIVVRTILVEKKTV